MLPPKKMAPFDLNQPINWEEEEIVEECDGTAEDLSCGSVYGESDNDKEEHVDVEHGDADGQADGAGDKGHGRADGQGYLHGDFAGNGGAGSYADRYGAGRGGGVASDARGNGRGFDLNQTANTRSRTQYTDDERRSIYSMLLKRNGGNIMKRGVSKAVAAEMGMPVRTVQRIWLNGRRRGGIGGVVSKKAKNCGRKRIEVDPDAMWVLPMDIRMTIRELAEALRMKKTTVFRRLKEGRLRQVTSSLGSNCEGS